MLPFLLLLWKTIKGERIMIFSMKTTSLRYLKLYLKNKCFSFCVSTQSPIFRPIMSNNSLLMKKVTYKGFVIGILLRILESSEIYEALSIYYIKFSINTRQIHISIIYFLKRIFILYIYHTRYAHTKWINAKITIY